jgi:hypothetical protein
MAAHEQYEQNNNGKRLKSETLESSSTPGVWISRMERMIRLQACEMAQLRQMVDTIVRLCKAHAACKKMQWLGMRKQCSYAARPGRP